ncbi:hypothetical protein [Methanogenium organophilum]|uniref:Uncharacterized protein n=1 Tax=Methanogenium organophilum TaxID=2199 RepID=A0A9X9S3F4_METOG|nr:hypothetical protein [Methanogenium organophilum]WAI00831.1 hypothetical protein OU421_10465 [Methanogenium organophilum]
MRDLSVPMTVITTFDALVQEIIDTNPFDCTAYVEKGGSQLTLSSVPRSGMTRKSSMRISRPTPSTPLPLM